MTEAPSRVLLYARVSRTADNSTSIARQLAEGREHATKRWPGASVLTFTDDGVSGAVDPHRREGFGALMAEWRPRDVLIFWRLDRLARSLLGFADTMRSAQEAGVMLLSVHDVFDLTTPDGRMQANIVATFAEWERELIRARVAATRRTLHKAGRWPGGRAPYGLMAAPHPDGEGRTLVRDPKAAKVIREVVARVSDGEGITAVARDLQDRGIPSPRMHTSVKPNPKPSAWSSASVRDVLGHPNIVGHQVDPMTGRLVREKGLPVEVWEPIVSVHERDRAIAALPTVTGRAATRDRHPLYGVVTCGVCGSNMHRTSGSNGETSAFKCDGGRKGSHGVVTARIADVEAYVQTSVLEALGGALYAQRKWVGGADSRADLERLRAFLAELEEDRKAGLYSTPEGRDRFRRQYAETEQEIHELEARPVVESGWQVVPTEDRMGDAWEHWTPDERGSWLRDSGVTVAISRPAVKRTRVLLANRATVDWGTLPELYRELDALSVAMD